jgi:hypothetical protein
MNLTYLDAALLCLLPPLALLADAGWRHWRRRNRYRKNFLRAPEPRCVRDNWAGRKPPGLKEEGLPWRN